MAKQATRGELKKYCAGVWKIDSASPKADELLEAAGDIDLSTAQDVRRQLALKVDDKRSIASTLYQSGGATSRRDFDDSLAFTGTTYDEATNPIRPDLTKAEKNLKESYPSTAPFNPDKDRPVILQGTDPVKVYEEEAKTFKLVPYFSPDPERDKHALGLAEEFRKKLNKKPLKWTDVKNSDAEGRDQVMRELHGARRRFMDKTMRDTVDTFGAALGLTPEDMEVEEEKAFLDINADAEPKKPEDRGLLGGIKMQQELYKDTRYRKYKVTNKKTGEKMTVTFFAPGSQNPTSDIDMQFIVEENPAATTTLIEAFQKTAATNLKKLPGNEDGQLGTLAEVFDTNAYPAGLVVRPEQGKVLNFSDTFTPEKTKEKASADIGMGMIRQVETMEEGDFDKLLNTGNAEQTRQSAGVAVDIALVSQLKRAANVLEIAKQKGEEPSNAVKELQVKLTALQEEGLDPSTLTPGGTSLSLAPEEMKKRRKATQDVAHLLEKVAEEDGHLVAEARNLAYLDALREVERYTKARDLALLDGLTDAEDLEKQIREAPEGQLQELQQQLNSRLASTRVEADKLALQAHILHGMTNYNADEAYHNRGALGHTVESAQMRRATIKTADTALGSVSSDVGFIKEHIDHLSHSDHQPPTGNFAFEVQKYIGRAVGGMDDLSSKALDTLDSKGPVLFSTGNEEEREEKVASAVKNLASTVDTLNAEIASLKNAMGRLTPEIEGGEFVKDEQLEGVRKAFETSRATVVEQLLAAQTLVRQAATKHMSANKTSSTREKAKREQLLEGANKDETEAKERIQLARNELTKAYSQGNVALDLDQDARTQLEKNLVRLWSQKLQEIKDNASLNDAQKMVEMGKACASVGLESPAAIGKLMDALLTKGVETHSQMKTSGEEVVQERSGLDSANRKAIPLAALGRLFLRLPLVKSLQGELAGLLKQKFATPVEQRDALLSFATKVGKSLEVSKATAQLKLTELGQKLKTVEESLKKLREDVSTLQTSGNDPNKLLEQQNKLNIAQEQQVALQKEIASVNAVMTYEKDFEDLKENIAKAFS